MIAAARSQVQRPEPRPDTRLEPRAICGYAADKLDPTKQHLDTDQLRSVSSNLETADYNARKY